MKIEKKNFSEEFELSSKKLWVKPECEVIGKDRINSGSVKYVPEGGTYEGLPGAGS